MDSAWAVVLGAFIGSAVSTIPQPVIRRSQERHERLKMAVELTTMEMTQIIEIVKLKPGKYNIAPSACFLTANVLWLERLESGKPTKASIEAFQQEWRELAVAFGQPPEEQS